jgi:hypothetical protein
MTFETCVFILDAVSSVQRNMLVDDLHNEDKQIHCT